MKKQWGARLTETINFIDQTPAPTGFRGDKAEIVRYLRTWNTGSVPARQLLSGLMSQDGVVNRPTNPVFRKYRRATILLRCVFSEQQHDWARIAPIMNNSKAVDAKGNYDMQLELASDVFYTMPENGRAEITRLLTQPRMFLKRWPLEVSGIPDPGKTTYRVKFDNGKVKLDCTDAMISKLTFEAINVPVTPYIFVKDKLGSIKATSSRGENCDLMLTTQFTGCTYCFQKVGPDLLAAHIDPNASGKAQRLDEKTNGYSGEDISRKLRKRGGFKGVSRDDGFMAYGRNLAGYGYGMVGRVIIVAVHKDSGWRVYAQLQYPDNSFEAFRIDEEE